MAKKRSGTFARLYGDIITDPKVVELLSRRNGHRAFAVYTLALAWCSLHLTDGLVPEPALPTIHGKKADAQLLETVGLWDRAPGGWCVRGYTKANATREEVSQMRVQGAINQCARWGKTGHPCTCGTHTDRIRDTDTDRIDIPSPSPSPRTTTGHLHMQVHSAEEA